MPRRPRRLDLISHGRTPLFHESSPSSPRSPLHPIRPRKTAPSLALSHSPLLPLTPPPRLYQRALLPAKSSSPNLLSNSPENPYPWVWYCHMCGRKYNIGVTRRCLEDGHNFCSRPSPPSSPKIETSEQLPRGPVNDGHHGSENDGKTAAEKVIELMKREKALRRARRTQIRAQRGCRAEFDYPGWTAFNNWRREAIAFRKAQRQKRKLGKVGRLRNMLRGKRKKTEESKRGPEKYERISCWHDCDFPSECHNRRQAEREWLQKRAEEERLSMLEEANGGLSVNIQGTNSSEIEDHEASVVRGVSTSRAQEIETKSITDLQGTKSLQKKELETRSLLLQAQQRLSFPSSSDFPPPEFVESPIDHVHSQERQNQGPVGIDCDGLGETSFQSSYIAARRKSFDGTDKQHNGGNVSPSSPLKEEFSVEDRDAGWVWEGMEGVECARDGWMYSSDGSLEDGEDSDGDDSYLEEQVIRDEGGWELRHIERAQACSNCQRLLPTEDDSNICLWCGVPLSQLTRPRNLESSAGFNVALQGSSAVADHTPSSEQFREEQDQWERRLFQSRKGFWRHGRGFGD